MAARTTIFTVPNALCIVRLILVGIGLSAIAGAATQLMITFGDVYDVQRALIWLTGSVYGRSWAEFWPLLPWVAVFAPLAMLLSRDLNALNLGEDVARGLGSHVARQRGVLLIAAVALAMAHHRIPAIVARLVGGLIIAATAAQIAWRLASG